MVNLARNTAFLTAAKTLNFAIIGIFGLLLPKFVNGATVGVYGLMSTLMFFGSMAASFGIPLLIVRVLSQDKERTKELYVQGLTAMLLGACVAGVGVVAWVFIELAVQGAMDWSRPLLAVLVAAILFAEAFASIGDSLFQAYERMTIMAATEALSGILRVGFGLSAMVLLQAPESESTPNTSVLYAIYGGFLISSIVRAVILNRRARREFLSGELPRPSVGAAWKLFKESISIALFRMLRMVRNRVDMQLLGLLIVPLAGLSMVEAVDNARALYGTAMRVVLIFHTFTLAFNTAIFPSMVRAGSDSENPQEARQRFYRTVAYQAWWAAPLATVTFVYADAIAGWFDAQYEFGMPGVAGTTGDVLRFLVIAMLIDSISGPVGMLVLGRKSFDRYLPWLGGLMAVSSIVLNVILIPQYGILGAAYACIGASVIELLTKLGMISRLLGAPWRMLRCTVPYLLAAAGVGLLLALGPLAGHEFLGGMVGAAVYAAVTLLAGLVDPAIKRRLPGPLSRLGLARSPLGGGGGPAD